MGWHAMLGVLHLTTVMGQPIKTFCPVSWPKHLQFNLDRFWPSISDFMPFLLIGPLVRRITTTFGRSYLTKYFKPWSNVGACKIWPSAPASLMQLCTTAIVVYPQDPRVWYTFLHSYTIIFIRECKTRWQNN